MAEERPTINLKILSPSTEVEGGISFPDLLATTTIRELRSRIQDAVPSKPATDRMRLIYRGRVVANDADTLGNVFGAESIRENKDQSLHLVLRELAPSGATSSFPAPRSSTVPPNPFRPAQAPLPASPLQTNPFRTLPQARPSSQPQALPHHPPHHHHHPPGPSNPFQIPLPPALQQHLAQTMGMAQNGPANNGQAPNAQAQQPAGGPPTATNGAQVPPTGLPPLPGFGPPDLPPSARTVRQEGIGPNGERWSVTYSNVNLPVQPQQHVHPRPMPPAPAFGLPPLPTPNESVDHLLPHLRHILLNARQDLENVRTLLHGSGQQLGPLSSASPPVWRLELIRQYARTMGQGLALLERGLDLIATDAYATNIPENPDWLELRQSANELRGHLEDLNQMLDSHRNSATAQAPAQAPVAGNTTSTTASGSPATTATTRQSTPPQPQTQDISPILPTNAPEELFILSSPQGPVGVLFDQRGTYITAPMVSTMPFQTFTNHFAQNRQFIAGLGQQIAHGSNHLHSQLANIQPTPTQQPATSGQAQVHDQAQGAEHGHVQNPNIAQNPNANRPVDPQAENDRIGNIAGHLWLLLKLACFVYFFSSGGGWYKSIVLGLIAGGVYLAQLGIFEEQFNLVRRHFEALLPVGALAERAAQPRNMNTQAQRTEAGRNITPEEAARRLLQQQQEQRFGWVRESVRTVERSFAIFVASLWPGIGERMVHAQEERVRAERAAEEERQRQEEERRRQEAEAQQETEQKKDEVDVERDAGKSSSSTKGKEKAEVVNTSDLYDSTA